MPCIRHEGKRIHWFVRGARNGCEHFEDVFYPVCSDLFWSPIQCSSLRDIGNGDPGRFSNAISNNVGNRNRKTERFDVECV